MAVLSTYNGKHKERKDRNCGIISLDYERNYLCAGSEDHNVYMWDLQKQEIFNTIRHHNDKVQIVKWHNNDPNILISAAFDNKLVVNDIRNNVKVGEMTLSSDVECAIWYNSTDSLLVRYS